jgi:hypothetical protein
MMALEVKRASLVAEGRVETADSRAILALRVTDTRWNQQD